MEAVECGAAALSIILAYYGRHVPLEAAQFRGLSGYQRTAQVKHATGRHVLQVGRHVGPGQVVDEVYDAANHTIVGLSAQRHDTFCLQTRQCYLQFAHLLLQFRHTFDQRLLLQATLRFL